MNEGLQLNFLRKPSPFHSFQVYLRLLSFSKRNPENLLKDGWCRRYFDFLLRGARHSQEKKSLSGCVFIVSSLWHFAFDIAK